MLRDQHGWLPPRHVRQGYALLPSAAVIAFGGICLGAGIAMLDARSLWILGGASVAFAGLALASWRLETLHRRAHDASLADLSANVVSIFVLLGVLVVSANAIRPLPGMALTDVFLVLAGVVAAYRLISGRESLLIPSWLLIAGWILLTVGLASSFAATDAVTNLVPVFRFTGTMILTPVLIGLVGKSYKDRQRIATAWLTGASLVALSGILDFLHVTHFWAQLGSDIDQDPSFNGNRYSGLTTHPNHLGLACAMALPLAVSSLSTQQTRRGRLFGVAAVVALGLGILVSGSRAALIGAIVGIALWMSLRPPRVARSLGRVVLALGAAILVVSMFTARGIFVGGQRLSGNTSTQLSDLGRRDRYATAFEQFLHDPLIGGGFAAVRTAHDIYLQLLAAGGVLALAAFLLFAGGFVRIGIQLRLRRWERSDERTLAVAATAALLVWLSMGLFQNAIYDRYLYVPSGVLLALLLHGRERRTGSGFSAVNESEIARHVP